MSKPFLGSDFLLETASAQHLFHDFAENLPIVDYHCHLSPREIRDDVTWDNITRLWLGGDHYKWRLMRANGVPERYITGDAPDRDKFRKWAESLETAVGNPLYHWSHLELSRYFGFDGHLTSENADDVWDLCNEKLASLSARKLIAGSDVKVLCTTDDPVDSLEYHAALRREADLPFAVLPAWRPEKAMSPEAPGFAEYLEALESASRCPVQDFDSLVSALLVQMDHFAENGCTISDHSLPYAMYRPATGTELNRILTSARLGKKITRDEALSFKTMLLLALGEEYARRGWVMQLHFGVQRNLNTRLYRSFGPDAGGDAISGTGSAEELALLLDHLDHRNALPKTVLYSLNPSDNAAICTVMGSFQEGPVRGKLQQGSAWWFNDNRSGMEDQMTTLASMGLLSAFVGMLTDSRSFVSYARHGYFRRILCNILGKWVENGEYPDDDRLLSRIVRGICLQNAVDYFGFGKYM